MTSSPVDNLLDRSDNPIIVIGQWHDTPWQAIRSGHYRTATQRGDRETVDERPAKMVSGLASAIRATVSEEETEWI